MDKLPEITDDGFRFLVALRRALYNYKAEPDFSDVQIFDLAKALGMTGKEAQGVGIRLSVLGLIDVEHCTVNRLPRDFYHISNAGREVIAALGVTETTPVPPKGDTANWNVDFAECDREPVVKFAEKVGATAISYAGGYRLKIRGLAQFAALTEAEETGEVPDCRRAERED